MNTGKCTLHIYILRVQNYDLNKTNNTRLILQYSYRVSHYETSQFKDGMNIVFDLWNNLRHYSSADFFKYHSRNNYQNTTHEYTIFKIIRDTKNFVQITVHLSTVFHPVNETICGELNDSFTWISRFCQYFRKMWLLITIWPLIHNFIAFFLK